MLKLTRPMGAWVELRDERTGTVSRVRAVPCGEDGKVQLEFEAPQHIKINRVKDDRWREGAVRA